MPEDFYTVEEMAAYLKVSEQTIRAWIRTDKVKAVKLGRAYRIRREEVQRVATNGIEDDAPSPSQDAYQDMKAHAPDIGDK